MVVRCPVCDHPNDADLENCQKCRARVPLKLREAAMVQKRGTEKKRIEYAHGDVGHRDARKAQIQRTSQDQISRRQNIHDLRSDVQVQDTGISAYSPSDRYGPPPTVGTAATGSGGRAIVDRSAYAAQSGGERRSAGAAAYSDQSAWSQAQRTDLRRDDLNDQAAQAAGHGSDHAAARQLGQDYGQQQHQWQQQQQQPSQQGGSGPHYAPQPPQQEHHAWGGQQVSSASEAETQAALAASHGADPSGVLAAAAGAAASYAGGTYDHQRRRDEIRNYHRDRTGGPAVGTQRDEFARHGNPGERFTAGAGHEEVAPPSPRDVHMPPPPSRSSESHAVVPPPLSGEAPIVDPNDPPPPVRKKKRQEVWLVFLDERGAEGDKMPLRIGKTIIGRSEGEVLFRQDPFVSPWHAQITVRRNGVTIKDMFSLNGILKRIKRQAQLTDRDRFLVGSQVIRFRQGWTDGEPDAQGTRPLGSLRPATNARVQVLTDSGEIADQRVIRETLTIGRTACDLSVPEDELLEDKHAQIQTDGGGGYLIVDLGTRAGIYRAIRGETELADGDVFQIGQQRLMIKL